MSNNILFVFSLQPVTTGNTKCGVTRPLDTCLRNKLSELMSSILYSISISKNPRNIFTDFRTVVIKGQTGVKDLPKELDFQSSYLSFRSLFLTRSDPQ